MLLVKANRPLLLAIAIFASWATPTVACESEPQHGTYKKVLDELQLVYRKNLARGGPSVVDVNVTASYDSTGQFTEVKLDRTTGSRALDRDIITTFKKHPTCPSEKGGTGTVPIRMGTRR